MVTKKITDDIDALNIHRTPLNCLLILKLVERAFDDSPVNRTEVIAKVLYFLFHEFDKIPAYATHGTDLKDCEYALGYLCEWMIRTNKRSFTQNEFIDQVRKYCARQMIDLDVALLFFVSGYGEHFYSTRYTVFHSVLKAIGCVFLLQPTGCITIRNSRNIFLDNNRYTAFPEVIEFTILELIGEEQTL